MTKVTDFIRIIAEDIDPKPFLAQIEAEDWLWVSKQFGKEPKGYGGKSNPPGFLPLTMGVASEDDDALVKNSELQTNTEMYDKFTAVHEFWDKWGFTTHNRAAFFRLGVGNQVHKHIDDGKYYLTKDRYHLSLQGTYRYQVGNLQMVVEPGTFFWFNNKVPHAAWNIGEVERVSLVFDAPHNPNNPQHHHCLNCD